MNDDLGFRPRFPGCTLQWGICGPNNVLILLTKKNELPQVTLEELHRLGATQVQILGGLEAIGQVVEDALITDGLVVTRIQGLNRYETPVHIASKKTGSKQTCS